MKRISKRQQVNEKPLPLIPDKRYFTISEVESLCAVKAYVLRYWEQEFLPLRSVKRRGNRRYYQHRDILLIRRIKQLLYEKGFTIEGARSQLIEAPAAINQSLKVETMLKKVISDIEIILENLKLSLKDTEVTSSGA